MLKTRILKSVFLTALSLIGLLLLYVSFVIHPSYHELLTHHVEDEAVRYVTFLVHAYGLDEGPLRDGSIPEAVARDVGEFERAEQLVKLRVFDAAGRIVYSTLPREIGQVNDRDYFHDTVAAGKVYSKTVRKDNFTAEMELVKNDMVETYVPIMGQEGFRGAIETYYDVTRSSRAIRRLTTQSLLFLAAVSLALLAFLYFALRHADQSILARERAEEELRHANEDLEARVVQRTAELTQANRNLSEEISERTLAQMALSEALADMEEAKEKMHGILRSVQDGLLVVDRTDRIVLMNRPAEAIVGLPLSAVAGRSIHELELPCALKDALATALADAGRAQIDFELERPHPERPRILQARTSTLRDREDAELGTVILMQDVTIERDIDRMKSDFLAMAAHELITPLASIMGYSELLSSESATMLDDEQKREFVSYIHRKAEGLSRIVDDLLDLSRIEAGLPLSVSRLEFDLAAVLERILDAYRRASPRHRFVFDNRCGTCRVVADPMRIEQVMENLVSNAVKYSPGGGEVRVACSSDASCCRLSVADQGIGMTDEQVSRVFETFYRVDVTDTARQGVGLGMSIAKQMIDAHGGTIDVASRIGEGTVVTVVLPRAGDAATNPAAGSEERDDGREPDAGSAG